MNLAIVDFYKEQAKPPKSLTKLQEETLRMFARGMTTRQMADERQCSIKAVRAVKAAILACIGEKEFRRRVFRNGGN